MYAALARAVLDGTDGSGRRPPLERLRERHPRASRDELARPADPPDGAAVRRGRGAAGPDRRRSSGRSPSVPTSPTRWSR